MSIKRIAIADIVDAQEAEPLKDIGALIESMREKHGLINPIAVRRDARLIAGRHRLAAAKALGWTHITCNVLDLDDIQAELARIDENLLRNQGTVLERCEAMGRRKCLYEALHPETRRGVAQAIGMNRKLGHHVAAQSAATFTRDTAQKTDRSERSVRVESQIAEGLSAATKEVLHETDVADKKMELLQIARVEPNKQLAVARKIASGEAGTVSQAARAVERDAKREMLAAKAAAAGSTRDDSWRIIGGDCVTELANIRAHSVNLVFADPPYNIGIDYGGGKHEDLLPDEQFVAWCRQWISECHRVLTDDGSLWLLIGDEYADYLGLALRQAGFHRRAWVKWYETFGTNCANNFNRTSRHLFYCVKDPKRFTFNAEAVTRPSDRQLKYGDRRADPAGKILDDVWQIPRLVGTAAERIPDVPTQLPLELLRRVILSTSDPGDTVLDPFSGSGTTGAAAIANGRPYIGIEKNPNFARLAEQRLKIAGLKEAA